MAHFSQDKILIRTFNEDKDIHSETARYLFNIPCPCMTDITKRLEWLTKTVHDFRVSGVIFYNLKHCDTWRAEYNFAKEALYKSRTVRTLLLETDYSPADIGAIKTKIEAFIEML